MKGHVFTGLLLCTLFLSGGTAQSQDKADKPVWTLEFIRVRSDNFGPAMGYLDDHWMRVRAEAKRQGAVLDYHRIQNAVLEIPGHKIGDPNSIVLMTEYKNMDAFLQSQKMFASMREQLSANTPGVIRPRPPEELFETLNTQLFLEEPVENTGFKLLPRSSH